MRKKATSFNCYTCRVCALNSPFYPQNTDEAQEMLEFTKKKVRIVQSKNRTYETICINQFLPTNFCLRITKLLNPNSYNNTHAFIEFYARQSLRFFRSRWFVWIRRLPHKSQILPYTFLYVFRQREFRLKRSANGWNDR